MALATTIRRPAAMAAALLALALFLAAPIEAQGGRGRAAGANAQDTTGAGGAPPLRAMMERATQDSELRVVVRRYEQDLGVLRQRYDIPLSPVRIARERSFHEGWARQLAALPVSQLNPAGRQEHAALRDSIAANLAELDIQERRMQTMAPLLPFARPLQMLQENRRDRLDIDARAAAQTVEDARKQLLRLTEVVPGARARDDAEFRAVTPQVAAQVIVYVGELRDMLENWYTYYYGFDPLFTWWVRMPYQELNQALDAYVAALRREWPQ